jgi:hypothetical protein
VSASNEDLALMIPRSRRSFAPAEKRLPQMTAGNQIDYSKLTTTENHCRNGNFVRPLAPFSHWCEGQTMILLVCC